MPYIEVPRAPNELTADWLTMALREAGHLSLEGAVSSVRQEPLDDAKAAFGTLLRIHLNYAGNGGELPSTFVAKVPSENPQSVAIMRRNRGYQNEVRFYREIGQSSGFRTPRCYLALLDEEDDTFVLLLEDLSPYGFPKNGQLSREEIEAVVSDLALSHGAWWESDELTSLAWLQDIRVDAERFYKNFAGAWPAVAARYGGRVRHLEELGTMVAESFWANHESLGESPLTLLHMDVRAENLFFAGSTGKPEPIFIDFQNLRFGRGAASLAAFLSFVPERDRLEERLIRIYHDGLTAGGVRGYSLNDCYQDYWCGLLRRFMGVSGVLATVDPASSQGTAILDLVGRFGIENLRRYSNLLSGR